MPSKTQPYILVADDDPDDLFFFMTRFCVKYPGFRVETLTDGNQLMEFLSGKTTDQLPRMILLDYKMPLMSGIEVLRLLSAEPRFENLPIIIWTTSERMYEAEECRQFGAAGYFVKPNGENELDLIITKMIGILESLAARTSGI
jgi:CheY-like chemotaxis protein